MSMWIYDPRTIKYANVCYILAQATLINTRSKLIKTQIEA